MTSVRLVLVLVHVTGNDLDSYTLLTERQCNGELDLQLKAYMEKYMPPLKVPLEAAEAFINQRPTSSMKVIRTITSALVCSAGYRIVCFLAIRVGSKF